MNLTLLVQLPGVLRGGVILAIALHALALVPQYRARYVQPRFVHVSLAGLALAVAHGAVLAMAGATPAPAAAWCMGVAVLLNVVVAVQNVLAVVALVHLHRASAVIAHSMRGAVQPMIWMGAALTVAGYATVHGWL